MSPQWSKDLSSVDAALREEYKSPRHHNKANPFEELIFILLSSQTNESNYLQTYQKLKRAFPRRTDLRGASSSAIRGAIVGGGLGERKARQLIKIVKIIFGRFGALHLNTLKHWANSDAEEFLTALPGIGKKSARCIMMYSLNRAVFPVDTNVFRIMKRWNWWKLPGSIRKHEDAIQGFVPKELRYSLHVNLVAHGRSVCVPKIPKCGRCVIRIHCRYVGESAQ